MLGPTYMALSELTYTKAGQSNNGTYYNILEFAVLTLSKRYRNSIQLKQCLVTSFKPFFRQAYKYF